MDNFFKSENKLRDAIQKEIPLSERMRPNDFDGFFGQEELTDEKSPLRQAIEKDNLTSLIFWGPPGSGKTTLARIIAQKTKARFIPFSASSASINEVKRAIKEAQARRVLGTRCRRQAARVRANGS